MARRPAEGLTRSLQRVLASGIPTSRITYTVDREDRLLEVNPDWTAFALANEGSAVLPERILGRDLWSQIADATVRGIYRLIMKRARAGHVVRFTYRCDSPTDRRTFEMSVRSGAADTVTFESRLVGEEHRASVVLLEEGHPRDARMMRVCSWCQRVAVAEEEWVVVEEAVRRMAYLEQSTLPRMTHGICPACTTQAFGEFANEPAPV